MMIWIPLREIQLLAFATRVNVEGIMFFTCQDMDQPLLPQHASTPGMDDYFKTVMNLDPFVLAQKIDGWFTSGGGTYNH